MPHNMILSNILFSSSARVWNLRLLALLLATIGVSAFLLPSGYILYGFWPGKILLWTFGFILLHHVSTAVRDWPIPGLAIIDLVLIFLEASGIAAGSISNTITLGSAFSQLGLFPRLLNFVCISLGLSLALSMAFRTATIVRSDGRFFRQRFVFLGACMPSNPPYTPTAILLNRSVARPLVRGESVVIIIARALILSCIAVGLPIFGIYAMVINPIRASIYTRSVATFATVDLGTPPGNITFLVVCDTSLCPALTRS
ncbi:hypothetical protein B0H14DRAFT_1243639 [Mycena olivaceomarginata]|nr:hypothetical protein B0H14DRAFT_1243639 [Mycena olivaceomarginata]